MKRFVQLLMGLIWIGSWGFSGDVASIKNGLRPSGKAMTMVFTEDLVIGPETDDENMIWPALDTSLDVDTRGHIFVCDTAENRVIEFDKDGKFVRLVGKKGAGPGEYQGLKTFQILQDGTAIAFENLQVVSIMNHYDKEMAFVDKTNHQSMELIPTSAVFSPDGNLIYSVVASVDMEARTTTVKFAVLDKDLNMKKDLLNFQSPLFDPSRVSDSDYWAEYLSNNMKKTSKGLIGFAAFGQDGLVYTATAQKYEVHKLNAQLEPVLSIEKEYEPIPMTAEEIKAVVDPIEEMVKGRLPPQLQSVITSQTIKKAVELAEFPAIKNPIGGLKLTDEGVLLVIHDANMSTDKALVDMFSPEGNYIGSFKFNLFGTMRMVFKKGYAYTIEERDDENHLVRYKYEIKPAA